MVRIVFGILLPVTVWAMVRCTGIRGNGTTRQLKREYSLQLQEFKKETDSLQLSLKQTSPKQWQQAFNKTRLAYKRIEMLVDYYYPATAKAINGPPVKDVEADEPEKEIDPSGFQVMEEHLFPAPDTAAKEDLRIQANMLRSMAMRLQNGLASLELSDSHFFDAARLHLLRLYSIGLAGADNGLAQNSIAEAAVSLQSMEHYLSFYPTTATLSALLANAVESLQKQPLFNRFDRAGFMIGFMRPMWHQLYLMQKKNGIPFIKEMGLVNTALPQLFDSSFFNAGGFSARMELANGALRGLGRRLFFDTRLSGNGSRSCASCHQPQNGYADNRSKSSSVDGRTVIFRNTPTILYAALQPVQFADSRLSFLEDQAKAVIENHSEMKGDLEKIARELSEDPVYQKEALKAVGKNNLTKAEITGALASFIRSQAPFSSPFDAFLRGDKNALQPAAIQGFNLFMGKAKCGTCHFAPLFNGVVPPHFTRMESEVIGVPKQAKTPFQLDTDEGKYRLTGAAIHRYAFKTPTLRNIALTAPYMHNGVYQTLEEVIDFYNKAGAAGLGISLPNQTLPAEPLHLTAEEKNAIVAFLHSLTDK